MADLGLAVNESFKNKAGETIEQTCFVDVVAWGRQAETAAEYLKKGSPVFVEGRLQFDQWESQQGEKRSKLRVRAERVQFLSTGGGSGITTSDPGSGSEGSLRCLCLRVMMMCRFNRSRLIFKE